MRRANQKKTYELWLQNADKALTAAEFDVKGKMYSWACFMCHQSEEISLKSFMYYNGKIPPKIHNLLKLLDICVEYDGEFKSIKQNLKLLNRFYIIARYPESEQRYLSVDSKEVALEMLGLAEGVLALIKRKIKNKGLF